MTRVDFYILSSNTSQDRFACVVANKAWETGNNVYIHTDNRETAELLDNMLWTFNDISFLPHGLYERDNQENIPVLIGWNEQSPVICQVMINLTENIPAIADQFPRIIEIVTGNDQDRQSARNRYRNYRDRGYELYDHNMEDDYDNV